MHVMEVTVKKVGAIQGQESEMGCREIEKALKIQWMKRDTVSLHDDETYNCLNM